ncbi:hypothetical protein JRQ81_017902 [Phrynocephalus forsythii]|uniref:Uncharacterized protein n=1 Tax=Phrynocephalus forsythii TaxID=171643 RepID=A0A9Q1B0T0_9SAUR|nr:hypothetical protein JRQ81_017902 [Phrynocephalus forsythii]
MLCLLPDTVYKRRKVLLFPQQPLELQSLCLICGRSHSSSSFSGMKNLLYQGMLAYSEHHQRYLAENMRENILWLISASLWKFGPAAVEMENRLCGLLDLFLFNMLEWEILVATVPLLIFILPSLMKTPYTFWTVDLPASHLLVLLKESIELLCKGRKRILTLPFLMPALTLEESRLEAEVESPSLLSIDCREDGPSISSIAPSEQCLLGLLLPFKRCFFFCYKEAKDKVQIWFFHCH